jgi:carbamoyl-phosphate synthase small subunit
MATECPAFHVVAYDFGVKKNILRMLAERGCKVTVVPAQTPAAEVLALKPTASSCPTAPATRALRLRHHRRPRTDRHRHPHLRHLPGPPDHGAGLGAKTFKMKFGHHGANHPVKGPGHGRVSITSQNHGFAVDEKTLPANLRATHVSLFDGTLQGLARTDKPAFCFQGHPEASPGPHDIAYLFDRFTALMQHAQEKTHA